MVSRSRGKGNPKYGRTPHDPYCFLARAVIDQAFRDLHGEGKPDGPRGKVNEKAATRRDARTARVFLGSMLCDGWLEMGRIPDRLVREKLSETEEQRLASERRVPALADSKRGD